VVLDYLIHDGQAQSCAYANPIFCEPWVKDSAKILISNADSCILKFYPNGIITNAGLYEYFPLALDGVKAFTNRFIKTWLSLFG